jgi:hypothetical protein
MIDRPFVGPERPDSILFSTVYFHIVTTAYRWFPFHKRNFLLRWQLVYIHLNEDHGFVLLVIKKII